MLLTIREVSAMTRISVGTLYHWVSERRIPVVRLSARCIRFRLTDLEEWIQEQVEARRETEGGWTRFEKDKYADKPRCNHPRQGRDAPRNNRRVGTNSDPTKTT